MIFIGIDPGKQGAIGIIFAGNRYKVIDMPLCSDTSIDAVAFQDSVKPCFKDTFCIIEKAQPMPKQGVVSVFNYGKGYGKIISVLECLKISFQEIRSSKWKKEFELSSDKSKSVAMAKKLFPDLSFTTPRGRLLDGRAEAMLLAEYARRIYNK